MNNFFCQNFFQAVLISFLSIAEIYWVMQLFLQANFKAQNHSPFILTGHEFVIIRKDFVISYILLQLLYYLNIFEMIFSFKTGYVTKGILIIEFWIFETIWKKLISFNTK